MTDALLDAGTTLFERIADDLYIKGYSVLPNAISPALAHTLLSHIQNHTETDFRQAGTGRAQEHQLNTTIRRDKIRWLHSDNPIEAQWLTHMSELQRYINRRLYLGLFSYECHFAHYSAGDFYLKHKDAFLGQANRILTTVLYLNPNWQKSDAGELIIYKPEDPAEELLRVAPRSGTLVTFLSEEYPHEVLPCTTDRYSIAGWFRLNSSNHQRIDPPR